MKCDIIDHYHSLTDDINDPIDKKASSSDEVFLSKFTLRASEIACCEISAAQM